MGRLSTTECTYLPTSLHLSLNHRNHSLLVTFSIFFQLLEICVLHWEYCSALALGQDVY